MLSAKEVDTVLDERKLAVLRAIVEDYVSTTEPVGSKSLVDRHGLDVSPATIRNDMAVLEEQGFIVQPHTSAGRIPTDKGYRLFVDRLSAVRPFSTAERRAIGSPKIRRMTRVKIERDSSPTLLRGPIHRHMRSGR